MCALIVFSGVGEGVSEGVSVLSVKTTNEKVCLLATMDFLDVESKHTYASFDSHQCKQKENITVGKQTIDSPLCD